MDALQEISNLICGIDEAGRGPLAGPVVASAVILNKSYTNNFLDDSKKLSPKNRESLFNIIIEEAFQFGIGYASPKEIDFLNIRNATLLAMKRAWIDAGRTGCGVFIDGRDIVPGLPDGQKAIIGGDGKIAAISAASIIAKVMRDWAMEFYDKIYPNYRFAKNKGYGTKEHLHLLMKNNPCQIHRQSFLKNFYREKERRETIIADLF
ncbi:MAG: ribonuclease HII [Candidatus Zixiibacteriota bacterium]